MSLPAPRAFLIDDTCPLPAPMPLSQIVGVDMTASDHDFAATSHGITPTPHTANQNEQTFMRPFAVVPSIPDIIFSSLTNLSCRVLNRGDNKESP